MQVPDDTAICLHLVACTLCSWDTIDLLDKSQYALTNLAISSCPVQPITFCALSTYCMLWPNTLVVDSFSHVGCSTNTLAQMAVTAI